MKRISREELSELLKEAKVWPRLRRELRFVPEEIADWEARDFLPVYTRSKSEGVIIAPLDQLFIAPFQLTKRLPNASGRIEAIICDICATRQRGTSSAVITLEKVDRTVSFLVCGDLDCSLHVRDKTAAAKLSRTQLRENNTVQQRIERLRAKLTILLSSQ